MKVCPVCEMEEEDDALSCSMCGSDFEAEKKEAPPQETPSESTEDIASDIAELDNLNTESDTKNEETDELSEEEKLLEETLNATVTESSNKQSENALSKFTEQFAGIGKTFGNLNKKLDGIFLTKGEINYIAPLTIVSLTVLEATIHIPATKAESHSVILAIVTLVGNKLVVMV